MMFFLHTSTASNLLEAMGLNFGNMAMILELAVLLGKRCFIPEIHLAHRRSCRGD